MSFSYVPMLVFLITYYLLLTTYHFILILIFEMEIQEEGACDEEGSYTGELGAFETEEEGAIVTAEIFEEEAEDGVEHDVETEYCPFGVFERGVPEKRDEDEHIALAFPYFGWPERLCAVGVVRKGGRWVEKSEIASCRMAKGVAVHEIGDASDGLAQDDRRSYGVRKGKNGNLPFPEEEVRSDRSKDKSALDGHAALPDVRDFQQMISIIIPVKEKDIPQKKTSHSRPPRMPAKAMTRPRSKMCCSQPRPSFFSRK